MMGSPVPAPGWVQGAQPRAWLVPNIPMSPGCLAQGSGCQLCPAQSCTQAVCPLAGLQGAAGTWDSCTSLMSNRTASRKVLFYGALLCFAVFCAIRSHFSIMQLPFFQAAFLPVQSTFLTKPSTNSPLASLANSFN